MWQNPVKLWSLPLFGSEITHHEKVEENQYPSLTTYNVHVWPQECSMSRGYTETWRRLLSQWRPHAPTCPRHSFYFCLLSVRDVGLTSSISIAIWKTGRMGDLGMFGDAGFDALTWPYCPEVKPIEHLWDVLDDLVWRDCCKYVASRCHSTPSGSCEVHASTPQGCFGSRCSLRGAWVGVHPYKKSAWLFWKMWCDVKLSSTPRMWFISVDLQQKPEFSVTLNNQLSNTDVRVPLSFLLGVKRQASWTDAVWKDVLASSSLQHFSVLALGFFFFPEGGGGAPRKHLRHGKVQEMYLCMLY